MTEKKVWFLTGAGRGMGVEFAEAALAAGNAVVASGRNPATVTKAVGEADLRAQAEAYRDLSTSLAIDDRQTGR